MSIGAHQCNGPAALQPRQPHALRFREIKSPGDDLLNEIVEQATNFTMVDSA